MVGQSGGELAAASMNVVHIPTITQVTSYIKCIHSATCTLFLSFVAHLVNSSHFLFFTSFSLSPSSPPPIIH